MAGEYELMPVGCQPDQRKANERRRRKIKALGTILGQETCQALLALRRIQHGQIDAAPRRRHLRHDDLHGPG